MTSRLSDAITLTDENTNGDILSYTSQNTSIFASITIWNSEGTVAWCRECSGRGWCSFPNKIVLEGAVPRPGDVSEGGMCSLWMSRTESVNRHNRNQMPAPEVTPACARSHHLPASGVTTRLRLYQFTSLVVERAMVMTSIIILRTATAVRPL